jgi:Ca2+-binding EF-hand superfamily protein
MDERQELLEAMGDIARTFETLQNAQEVLERYKDGEDRSRLGAIYRSIGYLLSYEDEVRDIIEELRDAGGER